jgi:hypothetical protein
LVRDALADLPTKVVFSGGDDLDIIPIRAGKGKALEFVLSRLAAPPLRGVQVCVFRMITKLSADGRMTELEGTMMITAVS